MPAATAVLLLLCACHAAGAWAAPCDSVDRTLSGVPSTALAPALRRQLRARSVDVLQSYSVGSWSILYVDTHESEHIYLFFSSNPLRSRFITLWRGPASPSEEQEILDWALKNAPGIPDPLARCFAWHVTMERDL
jgi:hypothetical protein